MRPVRRNQAPFWRRDTNGRSRSRLPLRLGLVLLLAVLGVTAVVSAQSGGLDVNYSRYWKAGPNGVPEHATHHTFISSYLKAPYNEVGLVVYTPPGYDNPDNQNQRYPVIYFLHGVNGNELNYFNSFPNLNSGPMGYIEGTVSTNRQIPDAIFVLVNGGRKSFYNDFTDQYHGPDSDFPIQSESIIINEVIPYVDTNYRTVANGNGRGIEGFSMGGRGALKLAMKYPDMFCSTIAYAGAAYEEIPINEYHRGAHAPEDQISNILVNNLAQINQTGLQIRMAVGADDLPRVRTNDIFHEQLNACNVPHEYEIQPNINHQIDDLYRTIGDIGLEFHRNCFAANGALSQPATAVIAAAAGDHFTYLPFINNPQTTPTASCNG